MIPKPTFLPSHIQSAYQLRYHFGWCTKGRKPILSSSTIRSKVEVTIREVAEKANYHVLGLDVDSNGVRALISLRPIDSPESVSKRSKEMSLRRFAQMEFETFGLEVGLFEATETCPTKSFETMSRTSSIII